MRYFGSKVSTISTIYSLVNQRIGAGSFCDPFGGIASVGGFFKSKGYDVITGDFLFFAHCFQIARIKHNRRLNFNRLVEYLNLRDRDSIIHHFNNLSPKDGWFVREYANKRKFFTSHNAKKIQACRRAIITYNKCGLLTPDEHKVLLASLIDSSDRVANTAGTYYAYLKSWDKKALRRFEFKLLEPISSKRKGSCFFGDAIDLVKKRRYNILYLDPPYNKRSYSHYYHLPNTIANEVTPVVYGASGIPKEPHLLSDFNRPGKAFDATKKILENSNAEITLFHYSDSGLISRNELRYLFNSLGKVEEFEIDSMGYTTHNVSRKIIHRLYLITHA